MLEDIYKVLIDECKMKNEFTVYRSLLVLSSIKEISGGH
jgi:hypothetical protein